VSVLTSLRVEQPVARLDRARVSESIHSSAVWLAASAAQSSAVAKSLQPLGERY